MISSERRAREGRCYDGVSRLRERRMAGGTLCPAGTEPLVEAGRVKPVGWRFHVAIPREPERRMNGEVSAVEWIKADPTDERGGIPAMGFVPLVYEE